MRPQLWAPGFTLLFEAFVMVLAAEMPVSDVAQIVDEEDTRLWRLIQRLVEKAHAEKDWSEVKAIAIDETSARRGRCYVTVIMDMDTHAVLHLAQGRDSQAVKSFHDQLRAHGGDPLNIGWVAMDMLHCYAKGVRENFPNAQIVYDRYHVMVMAGGGGGRSAPQDAARGRATQGQPLGAAGQPVEPLS